MASAICMLQGLLCSVQQILSGDQCSIALLIGHWDTEAESSVEETRA